VALPSGSSGSNTMQVQLLLSAPSLKAFVYAALSVFLSRFSTKMTDINKADSKRNIPQLFLMPILYTK